MKRVVIVGGGFAGAYCARTLEHSFLVTLIDTKDYFEFTPSVLRTIVEPAHAKKIQAKHTHYLKKARVVVGEATDITPWAVFVKKKEYPYDYLVIASGSQYATPMKQKNVVIVSRSQELQRYAKRLHKAQSVLIVGGGIVGVELAAEIRDVFPKKEATLIHAGSALMERMTKHAQQYVHRFLSRKNVHVVFNERLTVTKKGEHMTHTGKKLHADLVFMCTGIQPNNGPLQKHFSNSLSEKKYVRVNSHLQVQGYQNIFAAGDIADVPEEKLAQNAEKQATIVARNIALLDEGKPLLHYASKKRVLVVSLGKWDGMIVYKQHVFTGIVAGLLKQFIEWKTMRQY